MLKYIYIIKIRHAHFYYHDDFQCEKGAVHSLSENSFPTSLIKMWKIDQSAVPSVINCVFNSVAWKQRHFHRKFCNIYAHGCDLCLDWVVKGLVTSVSLGWRSATVAWVFASRGWSAKSRSLISGEHDCVCEMSFCAHATSGVNRREWIQINICTRTGAGYWESHFLKSFAKVAHTASNKSTFSGR